MKKISQIIASVCFSLLILSVFLSAQTTQSTSWTRVQSNNGEFLIEIPSNFSYFFDKQGFSGTYENENYSLKNMSMLNAYHEQTLLSIEAYEANKKILNGTIEDEKKTGEYSEFERNGIKIRQIVRKTDKFYCVRQYLNSKKFIYILTAASKSDTTVVMKRFFDSLIFKPDTKDAVDLTINSFSKLSVTPIEVKSLLNKPATLVSKPVDKDEDESDKLVIISKPRAAYLDSARMNQTQGLVTLRLDFAAKGYISKVELLKSLPDGLTRQALFAALRIKFIPAKKNGKLVTVTKTIEYSFTIY